MPYPAARSKAGPQGHQASGEVEAAVAGFKTCDWLWLGRTDRMAGPGTWREAALFPHRLKRASFGSVYVWLQVGVVGR